MVFLAGPLVAVALDPVLRRARELALLVKERLEHGARVVHAQADADRHQERQVLEPRLPGVGIQLPLGHDVEVADRECRRREQRDVDQQHLGPAHVVPDVHRREHQDRQHGHQQVIEVRRQVEERFRLDSDRLVRPQDARQELHAGLDGAFGPAMLLRLEGIHLDRHFRRRHDVRQEDEAPAEELRAVTEVEILGQGVVLPSAGVVDRVTPPDPRCAVEVEEAAGAVAPPMLEHEVRVEQDRLNLGQEGVILVDMPPARLDHAHFRVAEVRQRLEEEVRRRHEVRVENRDEICLRQLESSFEGAGLIAAAVDAMDIRDVEAARRVAADRQLGDIRGLVRRVVEDLNLQQLARVIHLADRVDQSVRDVHLVVNRQLDRDARQVAERGRRQRRVRGVAPVFHVKINEVIAMPAVDRQNAQDEKIQNEDQCLRQRRHKEMKRSRGPINDPMVQLGPKSTLPVR